HGQPVQQVQRQVQQQTQQWGPSGPESAGRGAALGPVGYYLGLHVERDEVKGWLRLHQHKYLAAMGEKYGLEEGRSVKTPLPSGFQLHLDEEEGEVLEYELQRWFQSMVSHASLRRSLLHLHCRALLVSRVGCAPLFTPPPFVRPPHPSKLSTWTPALPPRPWSKRESFLLVVVDDYYRYTTVFPMAKKSDVTTTLIQWLLATETTRVRRVSCLHSDRGVDSGGVGVGGTGVGGAGCERAGAEVTDTGDASPEGVGIVGPGTGGAISWGVGLEGAGTGGAISERTGVEIAGTGGSSSGGARFGGVGGRGACSEETGAGDTSIVAPTLPPHRYPARLQALLQLEPRSRRGWRRRG
ncbi:unnamed protein product, partial [Closterium sp. NIES-53]